LPAPVFPDRVRVARRPIAGRPGTRFYFADAAISAVYVSLLDKADVGLFNQPDTYTARLKKALRYVVAKYLLLEPQSTSPSAAP
jgi:hypothetical protein